jgi:hypothetical protein
LVYLTAAGEWPGHVFERFSFGVYANPKLYDTTGDDYRRSGDVSPKEHVAGIRSDDISVKCRTRDAADQCSASVED